MFFLKPWDATEYVGQKFAPTVGLDFGALRDGWTVAAGEQFTVTREIGDRFDIASLLLADAIVPVGRPAAVATTPATAATSGAEKAEAK